MMFDNKLDHIKYGVYLSNWNSAVDEKTLKENDIKAVLCINNVAKRSHELNVYAKLGIYHFQIDADDLEHVDLKKWFKITNAIIEYFVSRNKKILVHCTAGISRSVTIVLAYFIYLCHCRGKNRPNISVINQLYHWLQKKRNQALPNPGFYAQLEKYEQECMAKSN